MSGVADILKAISDTKASFESQLAATNNKFEAATKGSRTGAQRWHPRYGGGAPSIREGGNIMGSRGFSFCKALGAMYDIIPKEDANIELDFCDRLRNKCMKDYNYKVAPSPKGSCMMPLWEDMFAGGEHRDINFYSECKGLLSAGIDGNSPEEMEWVAKKTGFGYSQKAAASPAQSWEDQTYGGSFVPPPTFGPPIELLRNKEIFMRAGAQVIPLGPSGRIVLPRLTAATTGSFSQENNQVTPTQARTGALELSGKKIMVNVVLPGELLRFASPAAEQLIRNDMMKTAALLADYNYLQGPGGSTTIEGLATQGAAGQLATVTPTTSNQLAPQDVYTFLSNIEENNGEPTGWIMRPKMTYAFSQTRWTPYSNGTNQGGFVFELVRGMKDKVTKYLAGLEVFDSPQVSNTRGTGAQTYVAAGQMDDAAIALFGAIEMMTTAEGWTLVSSDQVLVRCLLTTDFGLMHPGVWAFCDALNFTVGP